MSKVTCEIKDTTKPVFKPITIVVEITLESREDVKSLIQSFSIEGDLGDFEDWIKPDIPVYNLLEELQKITKEL